MPAKKSAPKKSPKVIGRRSFRVGRSRTGLGVFATEPIKKRQFIAEYIGPLMTNKQCDETPENLYWFEVNARWTINGATRKNIARYINHSCRPNADPMIRDRRVKIRAIKNIKPGDEITYDYGKDYFNVYIKPHGCRCNKCREKRRQERAAVRAANARQRKRAERKLAQAT